MAGDGSADRKEETVSPGTRALVGMLSDKSWNSGRTVGRTTGVMVLPCCVDESHVHLGNQFIHN